MLALASIVQLLLHTVQLEWAAPPECPQLDALSPQLPAELTGRARGTVTATADGFELALTVGDAARTLKTATCDEAARAALFFVRLGLERPEPGPTAEAPLPAPPPSAEATWRFSVGLLAQVSFVALPTALPRFGGAVRVQRGGWAVTLDASSSLPVRFAGGPTPASAVTLREPLDVQLGACRLFSLGPAQLGPCLAVTATWLRAEGEGVSAPRVTDAALWGGGPAARAQVSLLSWLELFAGVLLRLGSAPAVSFGGAAPVVTGSVVSIELASGLGGRF